MILIDVIYRIHFHLYYLYYKKVDPCLSWREYTLPNTHTVYIELESGRQTGKERGRTEGGSEGAREEGIGGWREGGSKDVRPKGSGGREEGLRKGTSEWKSGERTRAKKGWSEEGSKIWRDTSRKVP